LFSEKGNERKPVSKSEIKPIDPFKADPVGIGFYNINPIENLNKKYKKLFKKIKDIDRKIEAIDEYIFENFRWIDK
jgi:hypothetical protein